MTSVVSRTTPSSTLEHFEHGINRVAVSADAKLIATSDVDMNVVVYRGQDVLFSHNLGSANEKIRPTERVRGLAFAPNADLLYVASGDQVTAISTDGWQIAWTYEAPRSFGFLIISPIALDVADNGDVAAAFDNGSIVVWDGLGNRKHTVKDNDSPRWLEFVANGQLVVGSDSFSICSWTMHDSKRKQIRLQDRIFGLDVNAAGTVAATRSLTDISLWDLSTQRQMCSIPVGPGIPLVKVHPNKPLLVYGERNRIRIVDYSGTLLMDFELAVASALSAAFTADGSELLLGCTEHQLIRRNIETSAGN